MAPRKTSPTIKPQSISSKEFSFEDELGRTLRYRPMQLLERTRVWRVMGNVESYDYRMACIYAACIREINGVDMPKINDQATLDNAIELMGDEGLQALLQEIAKREEAAAEAGEPEFMETVEKS